MLSAERGKRVGSWQLAIEERELAVGSGQWAIEERELAVGGEDLETLA